MQVFEQFEITYSCLLLNNALQTFIDVKWSVIKVKMIGEVGTSVMCEILVSA